MYNLEIFTKRKFPYKKFPNVKQVSKNTYVLSGLSLEEAKKTRRYFLFRFMKAYFYDDKWARDTTYRKQLINHETPEQLICVYCGKMLPKDQITVDHIIPINIAKRSRIIQLFLECKGYSGINDKRNLVPACWNCNEEKEDHWNLRIAAQARLGKYKWYWYIKKTMRIIVVAIIIMILVYGLIKMGQILARFVR